MEKPKKKSAVQQMHQMICHIDNEIALGAEGSGRKVELPVECEVAVGRSHQRGSLTGHKTTAYIYGNNSQTITRYALLLVTLEW